VKAAKSAALSLAHEEPKPNFGKKLAGSTKQVLVNPEKVPRKA
jgi:hypothetical protein